MLSTRLTLMLLVFIPSTLLHADADSPAGFMVFEDAISGSEGFAGGIDDPAQALAVFDKQAERFGVGPVRAPFNLGNVNKRFWFHTRVENDSSDPITRRLIAVVPYRPWLSAYAIDESGVSTRLMAHTGDSRYGERQMVDGWRNNWLISPAIDIQPGEAVDVLVQYLADGPSYLPLDVVDELELAWHIHNDSVDAALFYGFSLAAILLFLLFGIAMQDRTTKLYAALFLLALLMLSATEGYAFMLLWPNWPSWNIVSPMVLMYLFYAFGFYVADNAAEPSARVAGLSPVSGRAIDSSTVSPMPGSWLRILAVLSLGIAFLVPVLPPVLVYDFSSLFVTLMFGAHAWVIFNWTRLSYEGDARRLLRRNMVSIISALFIAALVLVLVVLSLVPDLLPPFVLVYANRLVFVLAGLATMATIISHVSGLRQDYAESLERQVLAAEREAAMSRELLLAEQRYNKVRALASLRQQQLAEASHDMKQPLVSLRSTLDTLTAEYSAEVKQQLSNAFSYLENLCANYLEAGRPQEDIDVDDSDGIGHGEHESEAGSKALEQESYSLSLVLETVYRMFEADAGSRCIDLRMRPSSISTSATPTVVIRIVANIVSNAIRHSEATKILIGVRRGIGDAAIIIADDGKGMSQQELERISQAYQKGPDSTGEGLGMAISRQLAEQNGMRLAIKSEEGKGSCFRLSLQERF